jgi:hypothetical protein
MLEMTSTTEDGKLDQSPTDLPVKRTGVVKRGENVSLSDTPQGSEREDCEADVPSDDIEDVSGGNLSKSKMFLIAMGMCLTYFLGVSTLSLSIIIMLSPRSS